MKTINRKLSLKGQSLLEYSVVIIIIVFALLASQVYLRRAIQGRWKQAMDNVGEQYDYTATDGSTTITATSNTISNVTVVGTTNGWLLRNEQVNSVETKTGNELIAGY